MNKSTKTLPFEGQPSVISALHQVVCTECGEYRDRGQLFIFQPNRTDWDGTPRAILCSWECGFAISERGIVHSRIVYGMDADQERKYEMENPGRPIGVFSYPKGHLNWEKLIKFKRKMEAL